MVRTGENWAYDIFNPKFQGVAKSTLLNFPSFWNVSKK